MSLHKAIHDALAAVYAADSGGSGLNNLSSAAVVRFWARVGDRNVERDRTPNRPFALTDVAGDNPKDTSGVQRSLCLCRIHVITKRDEEPDAADAICARLRTLLRGVAMSDNNGWKFAPISRVRRLKGPTSGDSLHDIVEFQLFGSTV